MRTSRLFWKLLLTYAGLSLVSTLAMALLISTWQRSWHRQHLDERLHDAAYLLRESLRDYLVEVRPDEVQRLVKELGGKVGSRITLVAADGRVLADSYQPDARAVSGMDNHLERPELAQALVQGEGASTRFSKSMGEPMAYFAVRVGGAEQPVGYVRTSLPLARINAEVAGLQRLIWGLAGTVTLISLGLTYWLVRRVLGPVSRLTVAARRMAAGNYDQPLEVHQRDELGTLAKAFNHMQQRLAEQLRELRESGERLSTVLGGMLDGVIAVDGEQRILFANDAAGSLLDFDGASAEGRPLDEVVPNTVLTRLASQVLARPESRRTEVRIVDRSEQRLLRVTATPLPGDPCEGVILVLHDLTELRRLESLRQEFVANVSHELKTPLSSIKAYAETLLHGALDDPENNHVFVQRIEEQADRLHALILDLLSLARIESGQQAFEIVAVPLDEVVHRCLAQHAGAALAKRLELVAESNEPLSVRADEEGVRQILDNLVDNAIKYTPDGGEVRVRWRQQECMVLLEVQDTGIGIAPQDQERLFERFFRVDKARSRELGGTGLGLAIVKHLARSFGGTVSVRSEIGRGSTFGVQLPAV